MEKYLRLGGDEPSELTDLIGEVINIADKLRQNRHKKEIKKINSWES